MTPKGEKGTGAHCTITVKSANQSKTNISALYTGLQTSDIRHEANTFIVLETHLNKHIVELTSVRKWPGSETPQ